MLPSLPTGGLLGAGLPALNELTSYAFLTSSIPGLSDTATPLAPLASVTDALPIQGLPSSNGLAIPEGAFAIPSGLPLLGVGLPTGFPPAIVDDLLSAGSPLSPLATFLAPAAPTPAFGALQPLSGFLLF